MRRYIAFSRGFRVRFMGWIGSNDNGQEKRRDEEKEEDANKKTANRGVPFDNHLAAIISTSRTSGMGGFLIEGTEWKTVQVYLKERKREIKQEEKKKWDVTRSLELNAGSMELHAG